ncbi:MAG: hypothetical protein KDB74_08220 [Flavobacteriales bacterium]|nr:hypothetical protein [Flavobacteriales bacterium]
MVVPIGTSMHEVGHYIIAKFFYKNVSIHYGSTFFDDYYSNFNENLAELLIVLGGPISTIIVSFIFTHFLLRLKKEFSNKKLIILVFSLFISREVLISLMILLKYKFTNTDEYKIFNYFDINPNVGAVTLLVVSSIYCISISLKTIHKDLILRFYLWAFVGSISGFYLWNKIGFLINVSLWG